LFGARQTTLKEKHFKKDSVDLYTKYCRRIIKYRKIHDPKFFERGQFNNEKLLSYSSATNNGDDDDDSSLPNAATATGDDEDDTSITCEEENI